MEILGDQKNLDVSKQTFGSRSSKMGNCRKTTVFLAKDSRTQSEFSGYETEVAEQIGREVMRIKKRKMPKLNQMGSDRLNNFSQG